jgi:uncharacterized protein
LPAETHRIRGYDLARAIAILAMVIVNYSVMMKVGGYAFAWIGHAADFLFGRAATLFVMLAGVSVSLMAGSDTSPAAVRRLKTRLLKRGALLLPAGLVLQHWWPADILHFYAAYLAVAAWLAGWPSRRLLWTTVALILISLPVSATLTIAYDLDYLPAELQNRGFLSALLGGYLASNYYPLFPWLGFFLAGMLLGRVRPDGPAFYKHCVWGGLLVCLAVELFSYTQVSWIKQQIWDMEGDWWLTFFRSEAFPVTPLFIFSSGACALAVIGLCRLATEGLQGRSLQSRWPGPLVAFGQLSLTMYIAHLLWGWACMSLARRAGTHIRPGHMFAAALGFYAAAIPFAWYWRRFFRRGPLEALFHLIITNPGIPKFKHRIAHQTLRQVAAVRSAGETKGVAGQ